MGLEAVIISISRDASKEAIKSCLQHDDSGLLPWKKFSVKAHDAEVSQGVLIRKGDQEPWKLRASRGPRLEMSWHKA